jgi:thioredoxin-related protein
MSILYKYLLVLTFASCGQLIFGQNIIKWTSWSEIPAKIEKADKKFMVYIYYDNCKWCKYMDQNTLNKDQISRFVNQNFHPVKLNAVTTEKIVIMDKHYKSISLGKHEFNELAVELAGGDMKFPTIVFLTENFEKIQSIGEYMDVPNFEMILSYFAGNHHQKTLFRRFANGYCRESHFNTLVNDRN